MPKNSEKSNLNTVLHFVAITWFSITVWAALGVLVRYAEGWRITTEQRAIVAAHPGVFYMEDSGNANEWFRLEGEK